MDIDRPSSEVSELPLVADQPMSIQRRVLSMRYQGYETQDIAHALSLKPDTVLRMIDMAVARETDVIRVNVVREAELAKLEEMEPAFLGAAIDGSTKAAAVVLKFMERRAALLGIDKQVAQKAGVTVNLVQILAEMGQQRMKTIDA